MTPVIVIAFSEMQSELALKESWEVWECSNQVDCKQLKSVFFDAIVLRCLRSY